MPPGRYRRYLDPGSGLHGSGRQARAARQRPGDPMGVLSHAPRNEHLAETCQDEGCTRLPCRMYKAGHRAGYDRGYQEGHSAGHAVGYSTGYGAGYSAGAASCGDR
jgi:hypothetical protein